jgi:hypothetical protein
VIQLNCKEELNALKRLTKLMNKSLRRGKPKPEFEFENGFLYTQIMIHE